MIKQFDNNMYVGEIKQLLKEYNLPKARIYKNEIPVKGLHYIKDNNLYYCNKDGELEFICSYVENDVYNMFYSHEFQSLFTDKLYYVDINNYAYKDYR